MGLSNSPAARQLKPVSHSLYPTGVDRTTMKLCWTPHAGERHQQPTYCWTFDNNAPGAF